jgi:hypothetical protein
MLLQPGAQRPVIPVGLVAATQANGTRALTARSIIRLANCGLVANAACPGIPAASQRAGSPVQDFRRYSSRSISACPCGAA